MRSIVWTAPRTFESQETVVPRPAAGEVLLRTRYAGICGSDLSGYLGMNSLRRPPLVMGHEFTGEVVETGDGVENMHVGEIVVVNPLIGCGMCPSCRAGYPQLCPRFAFVGIHRPGAYAEFVAVPARACHPFGDPLLGCLTEPLACSLRAVRLAAVEVGDAVAIFGAGIIGLFALKVATLAGAKHRILIDKNADRLKIGTQFGATHLVNADEEDPVESIRRVTGGGAHRVIDAVGHPGTRQQGLGALRPGGLLVLIGLHEDEVSLPGNVIVRKEFGLKGSFAYTDDDFARALAMVGSGTIDLDGDWLDVRSMEHTKQAFDEQIDGPAQYPKIVLTFDRAGLSS